MKKSKIVKKASKRSLKGYSIEHIIFPDMGDSGVLLKVKNAKDFDKIFEPCECDCHK